MKMLDLDACLRHMALDILPVSDCRVVLVSGLGDDQHSMCCGIM